MVKRKNSANGTTTGENRRSPRQHPAPIVIPAAGDEVEDDEPEPTPEIEWLDPTKDFISPDGTAWQKDTTIIIKSADSAAGSDIAMETGDENETIIWEDPNVEKESVAPAKINENRPPVVGILRVRPMDANPNLSTTVATDGEEQCSGEAEAGDTLSPSPAKKKMRVTFLEERVVRFYHSPTLFKMNHGGKRKGVRRRAAKQAKAAVIEGSLSVKMMDEAGTCFSPNASINTNFSEDEGENVSIPSVVEDAVPPPDPVQLPAFSDIRPVPEALAVDPLQHSEEESTKSEAEEKFLPFPEQVNNLNNNGILMEKLQTLHDMIGTILTQNPPGITQNCEASSEESVETVVVPDLAQLAEFYAKEGKGEDIKSGALTLLKAMSEDDRQQFFAENLLLKD